jgi:trans-aconitate methyltransferase
VLDVGAGTGLVAEALRARGFTGEIDAADLSRAMLDVAARKGIYRALIEADVTRPLPGPTRYAGIVSSGTFTHGHVGPEAFAQLLDSALPGCVFALSVNAEIWEDKGFDAGLAALGERITDITRVLVPIYGAAAQNLDPEHAHSKAVILRFRAA